MIKELTEMAAELAQIKAIEFREAVDVSASIQSKKMPHAHVTRENYRVVRDDFEVLLENVQHNHKGVRVQSEADLESENIRASNSLQPAHAHSVRGAIICKSAQQATDIINELKEHYTIVSSKKLLSSVTGYCNLLIFVQIRGATCEVQLHLRKLYDLHQRFNPADDVAALQTYFEDSTALRQCLAKLQSLKEKGVCGPHSRILAIISQTTSQEVLEAIFEAAQSAALWDVAKLVCERGVALLQDDDELACNWYLNLGIVAGEQGRWVDAETAVRQAVTVQESLGIVISPKPITKLAWIFEQQGKVEEAHQICLAWLSEHKRVNGGESQDTAIFLNNLADLERKLGDFDQAEIHYKQAIKMFEHVLGRYHLMVAKTLDNLGSLFFQLVRIRC
eukprot:c18218_g1_i2.p1 GENE.c18218_g1_i2~~c18218_g1_i2.p1  ORF type:complete len:436 (+),score=79.99 c18218_g1_i2:135-1310(+)